MKTRSAKAKGRRLQNLLVEKLRVLHPHLQPADIRPALMGESGMDVKLSTAARREIPFAFESKNVEALNIWSAIAQAEAHAKKETLTPAVIFARNRMPEPYVAVPLTTFLELLTKNGCREHLIKAGVLDDFLPGIPVREDDTPPTPYEEMMERSHADLDKMTRRSRGLP